MKRAIDSLTIPMVRQYLESSGWYIGAEWDRPVTIWYLKDNNSAQVILPDSQNVNDYYNAMERVLDELSHVEGRDVKDIILSIQKKEHISIRVVADDVKFGEIPITDGANLFQGVKNLIKSVVDTSIPAKKGVSKKERVANYMDMVTLGQTEVGSYAVNVYSPQVIDSDIDQVDIAEVPTSAIISDALLRALDSLRLSILEYEKSKNIQVFAKHKREGLTSGLCDALIKMGGECGNRLVEINVRGTDATHNRKSNLITFERGDFKPISEASSYLKGVDYTLNAHLIIGQVVGLKRDPNEDSGDVIVQTHIEQRSKNMTITLTGEDYAKAIYLHDSKGYVQCMGDIHVRKKSAEMTNVTEFSPIEQVGID